MNTKKNKGGRPPLDSKPAGKHIQLRVTKERKDAYERAAKASKQPLSAWVFAQCDQASGYKNESADPQ